jgi:hypothetical protein
VELSKERFLGIASQGELELGFAVEEASGNLRREFVGTVLNIAQVRFLATWECASEQGSSRTQHVAGQLFV